MATSIKCDCCSELVTSSVFFSDITKFVEIIESLLIVLHLKIKDPALHETLLKTCIVDINCSRVRLEGPVIVSDAFQTITLTKIAETVIWCH